MYRTGIKKLLCLCLPQRLKPQTAGFSIIIPFFSVVFSHPIFRNILVVSYSIYLQCQRVPDLYRAKNQKNIGLLALFFLCFFHNNNRERRLLCKSY